MNEEFHNEINLLKEENKRLQQQIDAAKTKKKTFLNRTFNLGFRVFSGTKLSKSFSNWFDEYHNKPKVTPKVTADLFTALVQRFVRVRFLSIVLLIFTLIPSLISLLVLIQQNKLIKTQNYLTESSRNSSYAFQLANIYDAVDSALEHQNVNLPSNLIGRIIGLSNSFKPYYILEDDEISKEKYSPERAQLLLYLVHSNISQKSLTKIYESADFSHSDLRNINLSNAFLKGINLNYANLENVALTNSILDKVRFNHANLQGIQFEKGSAIATDFSDANLSKANLRYNNFNSAVFINTNLNSSNLEYSKLNDACFTKASLTNANINFSKMEGAYFNGSFNLEIDSDTQKKGNKSEVYFNEKYTTQKIDGFNTIVKK